MLFGAFLLLNTTARVSVYIAGGYGRRQMNAFYDRMGAVNYIYA